MVLRSLVVRLRAPLLNSWMIVERMSFKGALRPPTYEIWDSKLPSLSEAISYLAGAKVHAWISWAAAGPPYILVEGPRLPFVAEHERRPGHHRTVWLMWNWVGTREQYHHCSAAQIAFTRRSPRTKFKILDGERMAGFLLTGAFPERPSVKFLLSFFLSPFASH